MSIEGKKAKANEAEDGAFRDVGFGVSEQNGVGRNLGDISQKGGRSLESFLLESKRNSEGE